MEIRSLLDETISACYLFNVATDEDKNKYAKTALKLLDKKIPTFEEMEEMYEYDCIQMLWGMLCIHEWSPNILSECETIRFWPLSGIPVKRLEKFIESLDIDVMDPPYYLCTNMKPREILKVLSKIEKEKAKASKQAKVVGTGQLYGYYSVVENDEGGYTVTSYICPPKNVEFFEVRCAYCELVLSAYMNNYMEVPERIPPDRRPKIPDYAQIIYDLMS